jgi:hypothetical protein
MVLQSEGFGDASLGWAKILPPPSLHKQRTFPLNYKFIYFGLWNVYEQRASRG